MGVRNWGIADGGGQKSYVPLCYFVDGSSPTAAPSQNVYNGSHTKHHLMQQDEDLQQMCKQVEAQKCRNPKCLELY